MIEPIVVGGRPVGPGHPVFVVAELSANHGHDLDRAVAMLAAARDAGADAVKIQTYTPDTMTIPSAGPQFTIGPGTPWEGRTLHDLYAEAHTPWGWHPRLQEEAARLGVLLFSSPFDASAVDFLESLEMPAYKIASFELVDLPLIRRAARTGRPLILSTGMASLDEIEDAVAAARGAGAQGLALLKCTSAYPAPPEDMNLATIPWLEQRFEVPVGLSDHTRGGAVAVAAVALGASIVEKHFTLTRDAPGPDQVFSMEPEEFARMVREIRVVEKARGHVSFERTGAEAASRVFRRSLFVVADVRAGEPFTEANLRSIRPGDGLAPKHLGDVLGHEAVRDIARGTPLSWDLVGSRVAKGEGRG